MDIYREVILDHSNNPRNVGILSKSTHKSKEYNPVCGDEVEISLLISKGKVDQVKHHTQGCAISIASASLLTEITKGKKVEQVTKLTLKNILELLGTQLTISRQQCAQVPLNALLKALNNSNIAFKGYNT